MVFDGGGHFSPAGIVRVHTSSLLLSFHTAHDRAVGNTREHKQQYNQPTQLNVGTVQANPGGYELRPLVSNA